MFIFQRTTAPVLATLCFAAIFVLLGRWVANDSTAPSEPTLHAARPAATPPARSAQALHANCIVADRQSCPVKAHASPNAGRASPR